jgi:GMP synthase (glutamine-hydrolysing)
MHASCCTTVDSPHVSPCVWEFISAQAIPVLGICYGMQEMAHVFGGAVQPSTEREFGRAIIDITLENEEAANELFAGVSHSQMWMSHGDKVTEMPSGFVKIAHTANCDNAGKY